MGDEKEIMYEWIHDDITWCWNECSHTECERNQANRLNKTGLFSAAMFKGTEMCPLTKIFNRQQKRIKGDNTMNKTQLAAKVAEKTGLTRIVSERIINTITETIIEELIKGEKVSILGFGTFETRERASRTARNPKTGASITIDAKVAPVFKAGKQFKDAVNE